ncbi:MAG: zinc ABC transporter solute-binding protein, partial [Bacteroidales bacterium]|nr:zinc ABC transporter solute-binding protein [Bacteroidales bacterium]
LDSDIRAAWSTIPQERRVIIVPHAAFNYYGRDYGVTFLSPVGTSTEAEASARDIATLIGLVRERRAGAIFTETTSNPRLVERIAAETGIAIGGRLYSGSLSEPDGPAGSYVAMMRYNTGQFVNALGGTM